MLQLRAQTEYVGQSNSLPLGLCRFSKVQRAGCTQLCGLAIGSHHLKLYIVYNNTDQFTKGKEVVIATTGTSTCPVEDYMAKGNIQPVQTMTRKCSGQLSEDM